MSKFAMFSGDEPSTERVKCDGLRNHNWKVVTADTDARMTVSGWCWCETCGALGRWNNFRHDGHEIVTELTLTTDNPHEF